MDFGDFARGLGADMDAAGDTTGIWHSGAGAGRRRRRRRIEKWAGGSSDL